MTNRLAACLIMAVAAFVATAAVQSTPQQAPIFRSGIDLVQLDVSVLDKNRQPVRGLTAADFTILEDRQPQKVAAFSAIDLPDAVVPSTPWMRDVTPDVTSNEVDNQRIIVLVLDDALAANDVWATRAVVDSAKSIINRLGPRDLATVIFSRDNRKAQNLTTDRAKLLKAVEAFGRTGSEAHKDRDWRDLYGGYSLGVLERVSNYLAAVPQRRKTLIYLSPGLSVTPGTADDKSLLGQQMVGAMQAAQRANVNFYPIDPCGLRPSDAPTTSGCDPGPKIDFLLTLANNTGGKAIINTNDFEPGITQIFRENSSYYLLGYQPTNDKSDGTIRLIDVKVNRPDVEVWTRKSYIAPKPPPKPGDKPVAPPPAAVEALANILPKADVPLRVAVAPFPQPGKDTATVAIVLGVRQPAQSERIVDEVDLLIATFTREGDARGSSKEKIALNLPPPRRGTEFARFDLLATVDLKPGQYEMRLSAHSAVLDKFGSVYVDVDVPDFAKAPLALSGVVIDATPGVPVAPAAALSNIMPIVPTSEREFSRIDRVSAFVRVSQGGKGVLAPVTMTTRVVDGRGTPVRDQTETLAVEQFGKARSADLGVPLTLNTLAPGDYLLTFEATLGAATARRDVRFRVR